MIYAMHSNGDLIVINGNVGISVQSKAYSFRCSTPPSKKVYDDLSLIQLLFSQASAIPAPVFAS
jgi:hypothetical protein